MGKTFSTGLLTDGIWQDSSNNIGIGAAASGSYKLQVTGTTNLTGALSGTTADFQTTTGSRYLQIRDAGSSTPSLRSVNDTIAQLRAIAIEAYTISLRTGASSGLTTTEALAISSTGAATFSSTLTASTTFTLDGTKKIFLRSNQSTGGGLLSGSAIGAMGNFSIYSDDGVAGDILGMYYWNGGTYRSALQFANVSSGSSNLLLMKDGGNVGIGTSSPQEKLDIAGLNGNIRIYGRSGIADNQITSNVYYNGSAWVRDAGAYGAVAINLSSNGLITFNTTSATSGFPDERMRITSGGNVIMGSTTDNNLALLEIKAPSGKYGLRIYSPNSTNNCNGLWVDAGSSTADVAFLIRNQAGSSNYLQVRGDGKFFNTTNLNGAATAEFNNANSNGYGLYIGAGSGSNWALYVADYAGNAKFYANASGTLYAVNTSVQAISSDIQLKTNIRDYDKGLSEVLKMKPRIYDRKDGSNYNEIGFIAQEMEEALPNSMKDGMANKDGEVYKTYEVNWHPLLVKAIQEQQEIINNLSAKVTALENQS